MNGKMMTIMTFTTGITQNWRKKKSRLKLLHTSAVSTLGWGLRWGQGRGLPEVVPPALKFKTCSTEHGALRPTLRLPLIHPTSFSALGKP